MKTSSRVLLISSLAVVLVPAISIVTNKIFLSNLPLQEIESVETEKDFVYQLKTPEFGTLPSFESQSLPLRPAQTIARPLPARDIPMIKKDVDATVGDIITTKYNSTISIPSNAFLDANGNVVTGRVEIQYREVNNPYEIFLSGLPMHYDSNEYLETAGMIEFTANINGNEVFPNPQSLISVNITQPPTNDYDIFYLDQQTNNWQYINKAVETKRVDTLPIYNFIPTIPRMPSFENSTVIFRSWSDMRTKRKNFLGTKTKPDQFIFSLHYNSNTYLEFKELRYVKWVYDGANLAAVYKMLFAPLHYSGREVRSIIFDSLTIRKIDDRYVLRITDGNVFEIPIRPFIKNKRDQEKFDKSFDAYTAEVNKRFEFENNAMKDFNDRFANYENTMAMIDKGYKPNNSAASVVSYAMAKFGVWNCDRRFKPDLPTQVQASFVTLGGNKVNIESGWMLLKNRNTLFAVRDLSSFKYKPASENVFFTVFPNGRVGIVYPSEFQKHKGEKGKSEFKITIYDDNKQGEEALKKAMEVARKKSI